MAAPDLLTGNSNGGDVIVDQPFLADDDDDGDYIRAGWMEIEDYLAEAAEAPAEAPKSSFIQVIGESLHRVSQRQKMSPFFGRAALYPNLN